MRTQNFDIEIVTIANFDNKIAWFTSLALTEFSSPEFWTKSASSTGVNHPKTSNCFGGNVIHTKQAFYIATAILNVTADDIQNNIKACILSATLLHDIYKFSHSIDSHGHMAGRDIHKFGVNKISCQELSIICDCVSYHMGKFGNPPISDSTPNKRYCEIVHLSDYLASRKFLEFAEQYG